MWVMGYGGWVAVDYRARGLEKGRARIIVVIENETSRIKRSGGGTRGFFFVEIVSTTFLGGMRFIEPAPPPTLLKSSPPFFFNTFQISCPSTSLQPSQTPFPVLLSFTPIGTSSPSPSPPPAFPPSSAASPSPSRHAHTTQ